MARRRSGIDGIAAAQRFIKALPDAAQDEIYVVLDEGSMDIQRLMAGRAPYRRGALRAGIRRKLSRSNLTAAIGLVGSKQERRRLFYGRILDLGRRAQIAKAVRRTPSGGLSRYFVRVRVIPAKRFVTGTWDVARNVIATKVGAIWGRIVSRASRT